jgi:serine protease inhibitor
MHPAAHLRSSLTISHVLFFVVGLTVTAIVGAEQPLPEQGSTAAPGDVLAASQANGRFAIDLYRRLAEEESGKNMFLSPFSVSLALTMTAEGAVDQTRDQMTDVLHITKGDLARIHPGQHALQRSAIPQVPPEVVKRLTTLRAQLKGANYRTKAFEIVQQFREAEASSETGQKLADEINAILKRTSAYELQIANALWLEKTYSIQPSFLTVLKPNYGAVLFPVDFKQRSETVRLQINQWVAQQTNDRIQDLLAPRSITDQTTLVITNAVYFKGDWAQPFEPSQTRPESFQVSNDQSIKLSMMRQWNRDSVSYGAFVANGDLFPTPREVRIDLKDDDSSLYPDKDGHTMLSLGYQGGKIQMVFLVPQSATGLADLETSLTYEKLKRWIDQLESRTVDLSIPKYKLESTHHLTKTLQSLGMVRAFVDPGQDPHGAQFDKLVATARPEDRLYISDVLHKTFVEVSEIGTEAAAATAVLTKSAAEPRPDLPKTRPFNPIFKANKPFVFLIRDRETANILFMGRYVSPKS